MPDLRVAARKSLPYLLTSVIVAVPYIVALVVMDHVLQTKIERYWLLGIIVLLLAVALKPLTDWAQKQLDRLFYGDRNGYLEALQKFTQESQSIVNLPELSETLIELVHGAMKPLFTCLLLPSEEQKRYVIIAQLGLSNSVIGSGFSTDGPFIRWMQAHDDIVTLHELQSRLKNEDSSQGEMEFLKGLQTEMIIPLQPRHGQLTGIVVLGQKDSRQSYSGIDKGLLYTLSKQTAVALENARLYDAEKTLRLELERQNQEKSEFLKQVAHEMKTPLTSLISSSELLGQKLEDFACKDEIVERLIGNLKRSSDNMDRRVSELLELARTQSNEIKLEYRVIDIREELMKMASDLSTLFKNRDQIVMFDIPEGLPKIKADRGRLEQIVYNLLSNAGKFSPSESEIWVRSRVEDSSILIEVQDEAPAIRESEKTRIFDPYFRGQDAVKQTEVTGLGLGLYITKNLVELHHGRIWIENGSEKGNRFIVSLPLTNQ